MHSFLISFFKNLYLIAEEGTKAGLALWVSEENKWSKKNKQLWIK